jgi:hypothetical protein
MQSVSKRNLAPLPGPANEINIPLSLGKSFNTLNSSELRESKRDFSDTKSGTARKAAIFRVLVKSFFSESFEKSEGGIVAASP